METTDFIPPQSMYWSTAEEFAAVLTGQSEETLLQASHRAKAYFEENFSEQAAVQNLLENVGITPSGENALHFTDDRLLDIADSLRLFGGGMNIIIQKEDTPEEITPEENTQRHLLKNLLMPPSHKE